MCVMPVFFSMEGEEKKGGQGRQEVCVCLCVCVRKRGTAES